MPDPRATREQASSLLLRSLFDVKGWVRDSNRLVSAEHSAATLMSLALVERHAPARVGELAERARVDASVVSRQLHQLEQEGLVRRDPDPRDRRAQLMSLTPAGADRLDRGRRQLESAVAQRLAHWDTDELTAFATTLRRLLDDLAVPSA